MDPNAVIEVFRRNLTEHYFDTAGRVCRKEFWYFVLASFVVYLAAAIIGGIIGLHMITSVVGLALLLPSAGLGIRRMQDTGRNGQLVWVTVGLSAVGFVLALLAGLSVLLTGLGGLFFFGGLMMLVELAALVVTVVLIYYWVQPGVSGANQYGPDPLAPETPPPGTKA